MTPRALDPATVHAKLALIRELLDDLEQVRSADAARMHQDRMLRYAVERILTQLVDVAVAVNSHCVAALLSRGPADYRESFLLMVPAGVLDAPLAADLAPSVGLRNVLTHEYVSVDPSIVVRSIPLALVSYRRYVASVAAYLVRSEGDAS